MNQRHLDHTAFCLRRKNPGHRDIRVFQSAVPSFLVIIITLTSALLWAQISPADEGLLRGPGKTIRARANATEPGTQGILEEIAEAPVLFYQHFLSHQWGHRCAYYPSCSNYALLAIRKHGAVIGTVITFDRLQHEANEVRTSPQIFTGGQIKVYDPLENNDYWWYMKTHLGPVTSTDTGKETKH